MPPPSSSMLSHTRSFSLPLSHTLDLSPSLLSYILSFSHTNTRSLTLLLTLFISHTRTLSPSILSLSPFLLSYILSLFLARTLAHSHFYLLSLSVSLSHAIPLSHTHSLSLSSILPLSVSVWGSVVVVHLSLHCAKICWMNVFSSNFVFLGYMVISTKMVILKRRKKCQRTNSSKEAATRFVCFSKVFFLLWNCSFCWEREDLGLILPGNTKRTGNCRLRMSTC